MKIDNHSPPANNGIHIKIYVSRSFQSNKKENTIQRSFKGACDS